MSERLALLVNPTSGNGRHRDAAGSVLARLGESGYDVTRMEGRDVEESAALAARAVQEGYQALVVMGGDGMVRLALQAVAYSATALGIIATGTGNDAARALGLPLRRPLDAADVVCAGSIRTLDAAQVGTEYFATVLAAGFDSLVNERANRLTWPHGQLRYPLATLAELRVLRPRPYVLEVDGERRELEAVLVAVGNTSSYGGGLQICAGARPDDGYLDVAVVRPIGRAQLVSVYPRLFRGTHVHHPAYEHRLAKRVRIEAPGIVAYADGERLGPLPVTVDVAPAAVRVFAPAG
ncbi:MAG TPA: diacylglycerol kinase [Nocardioidaceae bacterium]|nr:diacylglycerol kinase [Nocardioidaceae bacterium]